MELEVGGHLDEEDVSWCFSLNNQLSDLGLLSAARTTVTRPRSAGTVLNTT